MQTQDNSFSKSHNIILIMENDTIHFSCLKINIGFTRPHISKSMNGNAGLTTFQFNSLEIFLSKSYQVKLNHGICMSSDKSHYTVFSMKYQWDPDKEVYVCHFFNSEFYLQIPLPEPR